jgi:putative transcriptional regulator
MSPRHHPSEALLVDYATGALMSGQRLAVACHLNACPHCARAVALAEAVGGLLLSDLPPAEMSPDALDLALARIERPDPANAAVTAAPADWIRVPSQVLEALRAHGRRSAFGAWVSPVTKGPGGARSYLIGMAPGRGVARHTHAGHELTCVLKGSFIDGGVVYGPGDFTEHDGDMTHAPQATDEDCVCLLATDAPLMPADWVGRLAFPLLGVS